jgi:hypothetical protein
VQPQKWHQKRDLAPALGTDILQGPHETEIGRQFRFLAVVTLDRYGGRRHAENGGDFARALQQLDALMPLHRLAVESIESEQEDPVVDDAIFDRHAA